MEDVPIPPWWEGEFIHPDKYVLLLVRVDHVRSCKEKIEWLERNVFPRRVFPHRKLVLIGFTHDYLDLDEPQNWEFFFDWQDLYSKLLSGGFFSELLGSKQYFDFAVHINIRRNGDAGLGI